MDAGVVVDLLEEVHFDEDIWVDGEVSPVDIPVSSIVTILDFPVEFLGHFDNNGVLSH